MFSIMNVTAPEQRNVSGQRSFLPSFPPRKPIIYARGYERKGTRAVCPTGWKGGSKWEARCLEQIRDCSKDRAVKETKFREGPKKRGLNASG